jgi:hypothetical protein
MSLVGEHVPGKLIQDAELSKETKEKLLGYNAMTFLGLTSTHFWEPREKFDKI